MEEKEITELAEKVKSLGGNPAKVIKYYQDELEKANQQLEVGANQYALVVVELEKARELLKDANQLLWDGLRNGNELVPFPTRSKVDEITTFLNEGKK